MLDFKGFGASLLPACLVLAGLHLLSGVSDAADGGGWPSFMKGQDRSSLTEESLETPLTLKWKFDTKGPVYASPVVDGGVVFVGSYDKHFYALDIGTGKKVWDFSSRGEILGSAVVDNGVVYFGSKDGYLYALNAKSGKVIWKYRSGSSITSAPLVGRKYIYVGSKRVMLTAVDKKKGRKRWRKTQVNDRYSGVYSNPFYGDGLLVVASKLGDVFGFNEKGKKQWAISIRSALYSSPVLRDNTLYIASYDGNIYSGSTVDNDLQLKWKKDLGAPVYASPFVQNGVFIGTTGGILYALDEEDGSELWKLNLKEPIYSTLAVTADSVGFLGCDDGNIYAVDLDEGVVVWSYSTGGGVHSSPAIAAGKLIFGSRDGSVYALGSQDKEQ